MLSKLQDLGHEAQALLWAYPDFVKRDLDKLSAGEIPVFVFHTIEPDRFEAQLRTIAEAGYRTISAEEYIGIISNRLAPKGDEILLTIDDARSSVWRFGFPLLKRYDARAVLFAIPGWTVESDEGLRPNLDDVSSGTTTVADLEKLDPGDQLICSWQELRAMQSSGLVEIHSHTYLHRRVFVDATVTGVVEQGCVATASDAAYSPYLDVGTPAADLAASRHFGLPLFANRSLQEGVPFFTLPDSLKEECRAVYADGKAQGLSSRKIVANLQALVDRAKLTPCSMETLRGTVRRDLATAKDVIAQKMGIPTAGEQLCLPFTLGSTLSVEVAKEVGTTAIYWGINASRKVNRPGDDPLSLVRLKNDFIWRLPGEARWSLPAIYLNKVARRIGGFNPY